MQLIESNPQRALNLDILRTLAKARHEALARYEPFEEQHIFHAAGKDHRERALIACNQGGKTHAGSREATYHLTGLYPDKGPGFPSGWPGRRWDRPTSGWAASITSEKTRETVQEKLFGLTGRRERQHGQLRVFGEQPRVFPLAAPAAEIQFLHRVISTSGRRGVSQSPTIPMQEFPGDDR